MRFSTTLIASLASLGATQSFLTGDIIDGYPVISSLDLSAVPSDTISRYWFRPAIGQGNLGYYLPVFVARGSNDSLTSGRRLSLSASIHGDELNGIPVVQRVFAQLNSSGAVTSGDFNGTIIGIAQLNPNGNFHNQRNFYTPGNSGFYTNLNRIFPGEDPADGAAIYDAYAYNVWNELWGNTNNVDIAVDLHTLSTGSDGPLWAYADFAAEGVQRLAELAQPDIIKIDPGEPGSVETTWVTNGVPAITLEIGPAKRWNDDLVDRAEQFIYRLLDDLSILSSNSSSTENTVEVDLSQTYKGTNFSSVVVSQTGFVNISVGVLDDVTEGQELGVLYNVWGDVIETLTSQVDGRVLQAQTDPAVEQGKEVVLVVYNATDSGEGAGGERRRRKRGLAPQMWN